MNWKLIFWLSLFGLAMAIGTVFFISSKAEPAFWAVIFIVCAYLIAKNCSSKYFLHGLYTSLLNAVWITSAHILLYDSYMANHPEQVTMMTKMPFPDSPRFMMLLTGPVVGLVSGLFLGLFAFIASKIVKKKQVDK